jgi:hypothetical protein
MEFLLHKDMKENKEFATAQLSEANHEHHKIKINK